MSTVSNDNSHKEKKRSLMVDLYIRENTPPEAEEAVSHSVTTKIFIVSRVLLYLLFVLSALSSIKTTGTKQELSNGFLPFVIYPLVILIHSKLIKKVESELANNKDYLLGGILFFFIAAILGVASIAVSVPFVFLRIVGVLIALSHALYGVEILRRYK